MTQQANVDGLFITRAEVEYLRDKLETVSGELDLVGMMYSALAPGASMGSLGGGSGRTQPRSKPPYPMFIESLIDELHNELSTAVRDMCETRRIDYEGGSGSRDLAGWLIRYRFGLAMMKQAPELFNGLVTIIDKCLRATNQLEPEYRVTPQRVEAANRQVVTGPMIEKLAHKLGDQAKGLTRKRVDHLRRCGELVGTQDEDSGTWFYYLGDVIAAHKRAKQYRRTKVS